MATFQTHFFRLNGNKIKMKFCQILGILNRRKFSGASEQFYSTSQFLDSIILNSTFLKKQKYEGDPRSNANPSVISFTFGISKNGLHVYNDILSILGDLITFFDK